MTASRSSIRAIFFDLDDTLMPDWELMAAAVAAAAREVFPHADGEALASRALATAADVWHASPLYPSGRHLGLDHWELLCGTFEGGDPTIHALHDWLPTFRRRVWSLALKRTGHPTDAWPAVQDALIRERRNRCRCYPGVLDMLARLSRQYRLAIVTNGPPDLQRTKIQLGGLDRFADSVLISGELGYGKPDPRVFAAALSSVGAQGSEAVMVGDSPERDVMGAQACGISAIWVSHGRTIPENVRPDGSIPSVAGLETELTH